MELYASDEPSPSQTERPARLELRPAVGADVERVAEIWYLGWLDGHLGHVPEALHAHRRPADFPARVAARLATTTVATTGATVAGFVMLHDDELEQIYVAAEARGSGVADALLRHAERAIAERHDRAWLAVVAGNARARRFYERQGWRDAGGMDYAAEVTAGTLTVPVRRYEKDLAGAS